MSGSKAGFKDLKVSHFVLLILTAHVTRYCFVLDIYKKIASLLAKLISFAWSKDALLFQLKKHAMSFWSFKKHKEYELCKLQRQQPLAGSPMLSTRA